MLRELTRDEVAVLEAFRTHTVGGSFTASELAGGDLSVNAVEKIQRGDQQLTVAKLRAAYRRARRQDPDAALRMLTDVLGADDLGVVVSRAVPVQGTAEVDREVQEAVAASARVMEKRLRRAPVEELEADAQDAVREATEARDAIRKQIPQARLAGVA